MKKYKNLSGSSGVLGYETGEDYIIVDFVHDGRYRYSNASAGEANIKKMQSLAKAGRGLSTFITQNVRELYEEKLR